MMDLGSFLFGFWMGESVVTLIWVCVKLRQLKGGQKIVIGYDCDCCGRTFTELDEEEAQMNGYSVDPAHELCPSCYMEKKEEAKPNE
jgi:hypothetical protein